jgi:hypothetical protein
MATFNRGTPPPIPPPPVGGQVALGPGPVIGWQQGLNGDADPANVMDRPVPKVEPGRGGRQPTLSGAENAPGIRK